MATNDERMAMARQLAREIVESVESSSAPLTSVAQKTLRLAHLLQDEKTSAVLDGGVTAVGNFEAALESAEQSRQHAATGKNPYDSPSFYQSAILQNKGNLSQWRKYLHDYATGVLYSEYFSAAAYDVFARVRQRVNAALAKLPDEVNPHLEAMRENLLSENAEDWANAVHGCRRLLKRISDRLFPPTPDPKFTDDKFINRLVTWIEKQSKSATFSLIVGSHLSFIGDRIDAVYKASTKGSHADVTREEAERYVIYTYLLVGDVMALAGDDI